MKFVIYLSVFLAIWIKESNASCPAGWAEYDNFCYWMSTTAVSYDLARSVCMDWEGDLLAINSPAERDFVESIIVNRAHDVWFGLRGNASNLNQWWWTDGSQPPPNNETLVKWSCEARPNAPCNAGEGLGPCGVYRWHIPAWENHPCDWAKPFVCRRSKSVVDNCNMAADWHQFAGHCYKNLDGKKSWHDARTACTNEAAQLVMLKNQTYIDAFKQMQHCFDYSAGTWLGLSDVDTEAANTLKWVDGSVYNNNTADWAAGQPPADFPNGHKSNCVASYAIDNFKWRIAGCGQSNRYMCEKAYGVCQEGWDDFGTGYCYQTITGADNTWHEAKNICAGKGNGAQLMKIGDQKEQNALKNLLVRFRDAGNAYVRIGLSDEQTDNVWRWADGGSLGFANWNASWREETVDRMDCGFVPTAETNADGKWGTSYCFDKMPYICRIEIHQSPNSYSEFSHLESYDNQLSAPETNNVWNCSAGWALYGQNCYLFLDETLNYPQAKAKCEEQGAMPVSIHDANEQVFISNNLKGASWLGLVFTDKWVWDGTTTEPIFKNWGSGGKGDGSTNKCARLQIDPPGQWYNHHCDTITHLIICKKAAIDMGTPAPTAAPVPTNPVHPECGAGWSYDMITKNCFSLHGGVSINWEEANRRCMEEQAANLVSITSPEEQTFINAMLGNIIGGAIHYWIGLNDRDLERGWQWTDGSPTPYFNWNAGEPNNHDGEEFCVELSPSYEARWNDHNCSKLYDGYICKKQGASQITTAGPPVTSPPPASCDSPQDMVSGNMYVQDEYLGARHSHKPGREPKNGRMTSETSWEPETMDTAQWIEVVFPFPRMVTQVKIAGAKDKDQWVTKFRVMYTIEQGERHHYVFNNSEIKTFTGNTAENKNEGAVRALPEMIFAQGIRIEPVEWNGNISMRFEVQGCRWEEGMCHHWEQVDGESMIRDVHMTSSGAAEGFPPQNARLSRTGWESSISLDQSPWITLEFDTYLRIIEITTWGRKDENRYVKSYTLHIDNPFNENGWENYDEPFGVQKIFEGNVNNVDAKTHRLNAEVVARRLRFQPTQAENGIAMRIEVKACPPGCSLMYMITGSGHSIPDGQLSASNSVDNNHGANRARLFTPSQDGLSGGWVSGVQDQEQWIQADLGYVVQTKGITIQGRDEADNWIKTFQVLYSRNGENFYKVTWDTENVTTFNGDWSRNDLRTTWFAYPHNARYIRLNPRDWNEQMALRWDIQGCPGPYSYEEVGCYLDEISDRDLPYMQLTDPSGGMTLEACVFHCYSNGYLFAGAQYGRECFCGNSYGKYGQGTSCYIKCSGDPYQNCGGSRQNTVMTTGMSPKSTRCADGWLEYNNRCYLFVKTGSKFSWNSAEYNCQQHGGDLASIRNAGENDFIFANIQSLKEEQTCIGLHSQANKFQFEWTNFDEVTYTNWNRREPNNAGGVEDCTIMYNQTGFWNDDSCSATKYGAYVCQKSKQSLPPATSPAPDPGCGVGWLPYRWKCYHLLTQKDNWDQHKKNCEGWGENVYLARIKDSQEQAFLASTIQGKGSMVWTDLNDRETAGTYKFSDGSSPHYTHWGMGQPNMAAETSCVAMSNGESGLWSDLNCGEEWGAICEKYSTTETQPGTQPTPPYGGQCSAGWVEFGDFCYLIKEESINFQLTWDDAYAWCTGAGANLASIHSVEEQEYLYKFHVMDTRQTYWIGLQRGNINNSHSWSDGTEVAYIHWANNEPSTNPDANCVHMKFDDTGKWVSIPCTANKRSWICKIARGVPVSTPATGAPPSAGPDGSCAPDSDRWRWYNEKCYYFSDPAQGDGALSWGQARTWCMQNGGDLISIHDDVANNFTMGQIRDVNSWIMWMGLSDLDGTEGWSDNTPLDYTHWGVGQPNDQGGTALCAGYGSNIEHYGDWIHDHCSKPYHFICAKNVGGTSVNTPAPTPLPGGCPEGYVAYRDKCFNFVDELLTWEQARQKCLETNKPYSLASVANVWEQAFITSQLKSKPHPYWIGMTKTGSNWYWTDGISNVQYTNWAPSEPNGGEDELCVHIHHDVAKAGMWNDISCEATFRYICMVYKSMDHPVSPKPAYCPEYGEHGEDYLLFDEDCYKTTDTPRLWTESEQHCVNDDQQNGHLVSVMNPYEQGFLMSTFYEEKNLVESKLWIGLSDKDQQGRFVWSDGRTVTYTNWDSNQPDLPTAGCVYLQFNKGKWQDEPCESIFPAACKISTKPLDYTRAPGGSCPASSKGRDWIEFGNDCYLFVDEEETFANGRHQCELTGTDLVSLHSPEEQAFVYAHIQVTTFPHFWWIGMYRTPNSGFTWTDSSPVEFTSWADNEPSDNGTLGENCVEMYTFSNGGWNDINCEAVNGYVCKTPRSFGTSPTTPDPDLPPPQTDGPTPTPLSTVSPGISTFPPSEPTQPPTTTPPTVAVPEEKEPLAPGAVVGIVFGVVALILLAIVLALVGFRRYQWKQFRDAGGLDNPIYGEQSTPATEQGSANVDYVEDDSNA